MAEKLQVYMVEVYVVTNTQERATAAVNSCLHEGVLHNRITPTERIKVGKVAIPLFMLRPEDVQPLATDGGTVE